LGGSSIFSDPLLTNPWFYAAAVPAVVTVGLAKGGFAGLGSLAVPILTLVLSPVQAAAIVLPILISQDLVSVWVFRSLWDLKLVAILMAGGVIGVVLGFLLAKSVSEAGVETALGAISFAFGLQRLWLERKGNAVKPWLAPAWVGVMFGIVSGFTSQIAHAGAPPTQMYLMPRQLSRDTFLGTTTLFFALLNWIKVPAYLALGQLTPNNLVLAATMLPLAIVSTIVGAKLARKVAGPMFYRLVYVLMVLLGAKLMFDGAHALLG
jgi:uncharacterized membrane protein YfcA